MHNLPESALFGQPENGQGTFAACCRFRESVICVSANVGQARLQPGIFSPKTPADAAVVISWLPMSKASTAITSTWNVMIKQQSFSLYRHR